MQKLFEFDEHIGDWRVLIQSRDIQNGAIQGRHIAPGAVTTDKIGDGEVKSRNIAEGAVTADKIGDGEIKSRHIAPGAVTKNKIAPGAIDDIYAVFQDLVDNYKPIVIHGDVTNAPDEEDITSVGGLLKLKNRSSLFSNKGRVILRRNHSFADQVTLIDTIYEIRYDFDLNGETITIPENCVLDFDGGSVKNGRLIVNDTNCTRLVDDESRKCLYGNYFIDGKEVGLDWIAENRHAYDYRQNEYLSVTGDHLVGVQSIAATEDYIFSFNINGDRASQKPVCILFDKYYNYLGKSVIDSLSHANDATVMNGYIYMATCQNFRMDIDKISIDTLVDNCINLVVTVPEHIEIGYKSVSIDYCPNCDEICVLCQYPESGSYSLPYTYRFHIYDSDFNLKRVTSANCWDKIKDYCGVYDGVYQGMVYENGEVTFNLWATSLQGSDAKATTLMLKYDTVLDKVVGSDDLREYVNTWNEPEGFCKYVDGTYLMNSHASIPNTVYIQQLRNDGKDIFPILGKGRAVNIANSNRPYATYVHNGDYDWVQRDNVWVQVARDKDYIADGSKERPYKTVDAAIALADSPSNRLEVYLMKDTNVDYKCSTITLRPGAYMGVYIWGDHGENAPVLDAFLDVRGSTLMIREITVKNGFDTNAVLRMVQGAFVELEGTTVDGGGRNGISITDATVGGTGITFKDCAKCFETYFGSKCTIQRADKFSILTNPNVVSSTIFATQGGTVFQNSRNEFLTLHVYDSADIDVAKALLKEDSTLKRGYTRSQLVGVFFGTNITNDGDTYRRGKGYWNGSNFINYDGNEQYNDYDGRPYGIVRSGIISQRPKGEGANGILVPPRDFGFRFYDTTINKPIYVKEILGDGCVVWVDGTGRDADNSVVPNTYVVNFPGGLKKEIPSGTAIALNTQHGTLEKFKINVYNGELLTQNNVSSYSGSIVSEVYDEYGNFIRKYEVANTNPGTLVYFHVSKGTTRIEVEDFADYHSETASSNFHGNTTNQSEAYQNIAQYLVIPADAIYIRGNYGSTYGDLRLFKDRDNIFYIATGGTNITGDICHLRKSAAKEGALASLSISRCSGIFGDVSALLDIIGQRPDVIGSGKTLTWYLSGTNLTFNDVLLNKQVSIVFDAQGNYTVDNVARKTKVAIIGDSISSFEGTGPNDYPNVYPVKYPWDNVDSVNEMWWHLVCSTRQYIPTNASWSGSRATGAPKGDTAYAGCSDQRIEDVGRKGIPDIILVAIGCNDWAHIGNTSDPVYLGTWVSPEQSIPDDSNYAPNERIRDFSQAYGLMLKKLKLAYPDSTIYCCTILDDTSRDQTPGSPSDHGGVTTDQFNQRIKDIATDMGVNVIDTHECGINYETADLYLPDGLHPNAEGMEKIGTYVLIHMN